MYAINNAAGHTVARARSKEAAHRATRRSRSTGSRVAKAREVQEKLGHEIRLALRQLGAKEGYVVVASMGPYDHNPFDYPLPSPEYPRVFKALYEAVEYAQTMKGWEKVKIDRVDGSVLPGTKVLASKVVWQSWTPGTHGGWSLNRAGLSQSAKRSAMVRGTFADYEAQARAQAWARRQQHTLVTGGRGRQTIAMTPGETVVMERPNFAGTDYANILRQAFDEPITPERASGSGRVYVVITDKQHARGVSKAAKTLGKIFQTKAHYGMRNALYIGYDNATGRELARGTKVVDVLKAHGIGAYRDEHGD